MCGEGVAKCPFLARSFPAFGKEPRGRMSAVRVYFLLGGGVQVQVPHVQAKAALVSWFIHPACSPGQAKSSLNLRAAHEMRQLGFLPASRLDCPAFLSSLGSLVSWSPLWKGGGGLRLLQLFSPLRDKLQLPNY